MKEEEKREKYKKKSEIILNC